jgi:4'-phosphopantetheinyl transferase
MVFFNSLRHTFAMLNKDHTLRVTFNRDSGPVSTAFSVVCTTSTATDGLSLPEQKRYEAFSSPARKIGFLNGRLSAKSALANLVPTAALSDIEIYNGVMEQPLIRAAQYHGFQVGISHTGAVAMAVAYPEAHPVAVDIERVRLSATNAVASHLSESEVALLADLNMACGHTLFWSVRESVSKMLKTGMMANPLFYQIKDVQPLFTDVFDVSFVHLFQYKAVCFVVDDYVVSVCFPKKSVWENWKEFHLFLQKKKCD